MKRLQKWMSNFNESKKNQYYFQNTTYYFKNKDHGNKIMFHILFVVCVIIRDQYLNSKPEILFSIILIKIS